MINDEESRNQIRHIRAPYTAGASSGVTNDVGLSRYPHIPRVSRDQVLTPDTKHSQGCIYTGRHTQNLHKI